MTDHDPDRFASRLSDADCDRLLADAAAGGPTLLATYLRDLAALGSSEKPAADLPGSAAALAAFREQAAGRPHPRFTARMAAVGSGLGLLLAGGVAAAATGHLPAPIRHVLPQLPGSTSPSDAPTSPSPTAAPGAGQPTGTPAGAAPGGSPAAGGVPGAAHHHSRTTAVVPGHAATSGPTGAHASPTPGHDQGNGKSRSHANPGRTSNHGKHLGGTKPHPTASPRGHRATVSTPPRGNGNGNGQSPTKASSNGNGRQHQATDTGSATNGHPAGHGKGSAAPV